MSLGWLALTLKLWGILDCCFILRALGSSTWTCLRFQIWSPPHHYRVWSIMWNQIVKLWRPHSLASFFPLSSHQGEFQPVWTGFEGQTVLWLEIFTSGLSLVHRTALSEKPFVIYSLLCMWEMFQTIWGALHSNSMLEIHTYRRCAGRIYLLVKISYYQLHQCVSLLSTHYLFPSILFQKRNRFILKESVDWVNVVCYSLTKLNRAW